MSRQFNDTTNYTGLVQNYELEIGANQGDVSGNTYKLKEFTSRTKTAFDRYFHLALAAGGKWQFDDSNQTDYPIITTNLVDGQRDYSFTTDGSSNLILDVFKVLILPSATSTTYQEVLPVDQQGDRDMEGFWNGQNGEGTPWKYDKTANGIFLDPIPSYNATSGLKVYVNREASYFSSSDTTKKPGVPGIHHDYFYLYPAMEYLRINGTDSQYLKVKGTVAELEQSIKEYFGHRARDERQQLTMAPIRFR